MSTAEELKNTMLKPSVQGMNPKNEALSVTYSNCSPLLPSRYSTALSGLDKVIEQTDKIAYTQSVIERIKKFATSGEIEVGGILRRPDDYCDENNVEYLKYLYFFRSINFNPEICELILHPKANATRATILETPLAILMIESLKKG